MAVAMAVLGLRAAVVAKAARVPPQLQGQEPAQVQASQQGKAPRSKGQSRLGASCCCIWCVA